MRDIPTSSIERGKKRKGTRKKETCGICLLHQESKNTRMTHPLPCSLAPCPARPPHRHRYRTETETETETDPHTVTDTDTGTGTGTGTDTDTHAGAEQAVQV